MRSFLISLVFLFVTLFSVSANAFFVSALLNEAYENLEALPSQPSEEELGQIRADVEDIRNTWEKSLSFLSLSVKGERLRDLSVSLGNLTEYCKNSSVADYMAARSECLLRLDYIRKLERFSFANVV